MIYKIRLLLIILLCLLNFIACSKLNTVPQNVTTLQQMIRMTSEKNDFDFKAVVKVADHYLKAHLYADFHLGTVDILIYNGRLSIKKQDAPFSDMILEIIAKDLFVTYYGGEQPYTSKQRYEYRYVINGNEKTVFSKSNQPLYHIKYEEKMIIIHNIKHQYILKILNDKPIKL